MSEASYISDVYMEQGGAALRVKEGGTGVVETGAIADANPVGQAPVVHRIDIADGAGDTDVVLEHKTRIIDVWAVKTTGNGGAGDTVTVKNGANAITDDVDIGVNDKLTARAGSIDDAYHEIAAAGTLKITAAKVTNCACTVYVLGIRVA